MLVPVAGKTDSIARIKKKKKIMYFWLEADANFPHWPESSKEHSLLTAWLHNKHTTTDNEALYS